MSFGIIYLLGILTYALGTRISTIENGYRFEYNVDRGNVISEVNANDEIVARSINSLLDTVNQTFNPEESLSGEYWLASAETAFAVVTLGSDLKDTAESVYTATKNTINKSIDKVDEIVDSGKRLLKGNNGLDEPIAGDNTDNFLKGNVAKETGDLNWFHTSVLKPKNTTIYNAEAAKNTHIQLP